ncbi:LLM class flavin-dependent oxidoreductase [Kribbella sancticallisti]|uniref:LLM class flavin-dependent oxidoreductase n=1 Tax=Kribbella sancticallisti TaxID=460087 RepID=A0ABP4QNA4_9ACTN
MKVSLMFFAGRAAPIDQGSPLYQLLLDAAALADEAGMTAVWTPERHFSQFGGTFPNPSVVSAAVAVTTKRLRIRAGSVISPLHDPLRIAEEWAVVDNLSNGRVELSFGSGWNTNDFVLAPDRYEDRREAMRRDIDTVKALWSGQPVTRRNGSGQEIEVRTLPCPVQAELPIWLTAQSDATFDSAARSGLPVLTNLNFNSPDTLARRCAAYRQAADSTGQNGRTSVALMLPTYLAPTDAAARRQSAEPLRDYLRQNLNLRADFAAGKRPATQASPPTPDEIEQIVEAGVRRVQDWAGLIGAPPTVAARLDAFEAQGIDEIACLVDFGTDHQSTMASLGLLAELATSSSAPTN